MDQIFTILESLTGNVTYQWEQLKTVSNNALDQMPQRHDGSLDLPSTLANAIKPSTRSTRARPQEVYKATTTEPSWRTPTQPPPAHRRGSSGSPAYPRQNRRNAVPPIVTFDRPPALLHNIGDGAEDSRCVQVPRQFISNDGSLDKEINSRICKASQALGRLGTCVLERLNMQ
ncbi:hypothetical protein RRG08_062858 [Elysia crispata]|uniref:Uncharacterized protein n=1 Tax=Elysia crispata TaxID=231223 RepID=A0AAE0ZVC8_9GAST|nr:hypothetical protein RRG08_062858 [Elysia crispata]